MKMTKEIADRVVQHKTQKWRFKIVGILSRDLVNCYRISVKLSASIFRSSGQSIVSQEGVDCIDHEYGDSTLLRNESDHLPLDST
jgi:hypothetical protein